MGDQKQPSQAQIEYLANIISQKTKYEKALVIAKDFLRHYEPEEEPKKAVVSCYVWAVYDDGYETEPITQECELFESDSGVGVRPHNKNWTIPVDRKGLVTEIRISPGGWKGLSVPLTMMKHVHPTDNLVIEPK